MNLLYKTMFLFAVGLIFVVSLFGVACWKNAGEIIKVSGLEVSQYKDRLKALTPAETVISKVLWGAQIDEFSKICPSLPNIIDKKPKMTVAGSLAAQLQFKFRPKRKVFTSQFERLLLTCRLESKFKQQDIIGMYLSRAYFGNDEYGIEVAAQSLFNNPVSALNEEELLKLAALIQYPNLREAPIKLVNHVNLLKQKYKNQFPN